MIKLVYCICRHPEVSQAEFHRYWLEEHGPLVRSVASAIGARRYVQSHTVEPEVNDALTRSRGSGQPYDGITEVWWESRDALLAGTSSPEGIAAGKKLLEDESGFIDFARSRLFVTEEHEIFDLQAG